MARLDLLEGAGALQPAGLTDWVADIANRPLTSGDKLWVDAGSRAELHLGSAAIRMGQNTALQFLNVADGLTQLRLTAGSLNLRVRYLSPDETFEVDTPNVAVNLRQAGEFRIDVNDAGDAIAVAVLRGQAEISGQTQSFMLEPGQRGEFRGAELLDVDFGDLPAPDGFDQWAQARDQREDELLSANFMSRDVTGYEDLDAYGTWQTEPDYGPVWVPQVLVGWAPYSVGHWIWIAPWGWTWIDDAPWGFAPFHYGRWVRVGPGWGWSPGRIAVRPVYAPALVAWSVGLGFGAGVAWFPLGYDEWFLPAYRASNNYVRRVNVTNTYIDSTAIVGNNLAGANHRYANQAIPGAVTAVTKEDFVSARPVRGAHATMDVGAAAASAASTSSIAIRPTPKSFARAAASGVPVPVRPAPAIFARAVVARSTPPRVPGAAVEPRRVIVTSAPRPQPASRPIVEAPGPAEAMTPGREPANGNDRPAMLPRTETADRPPRVDRPAQPVVRSPVAQQPSPAASSRPMESRPIESRPMESRPVESSPAESRPLERVPPPQPKKDAPAAEPSPKAREKQPAKAER